MSVVAANRSESSSFTDYFDFFNLPRQFQIDRSVLDRAYLTIQQEVHPDKFVNQDDQQKNATSTKESQGGTSQRIGHEPGKGNDQEEQEEKDHKADQCNQYQHAKGPGKTSDGSQFEQLQPGFKVFRQQFPVFLVEVVEVFWGRHMGLGVKGMRGKG